MADKKSIFYNIDRKTLIIYLVLVLVGWISIYAAVYDANNSSILDLDCNYGKQLIWILTSFMLGCVILFLDAKFYSTFAYGFYLVTMFLLFVVLIVGRVISGNQGWIDIGSFKLQPAEFAKFATALALARYLSASGVRMQFLSTKLLATLIIGVPMGLILLQGDVGSALTYVAFILVLYREGLPGEILVFGLLSAVLFVLTLLLPQQALLIGIGVAAVMLVYYFRKNRSRILVVVLGLIFSVGVVFGVDYVFHNVLKTHHRDRINNLLGKEVDLKGTGYNVNQSKIAIGSGGIFGKGFLQGTQTKYDFVPEQSTDFIFCTIGEEYGFLGSAIVIGLYLTMLLRIVTLAERQRSHFSRIYGYGVASILFFHLAINVGMTIGLVPVIGIPLPFISYGGSSLWGFTILLFIMLKMDANRMAIIR